MKVLILGGSYFVGLSLLEVLEKDLRNEIWVLNRGTRELPNNLHVNKLVADRNNMKSMQQVLKGHNFDVVYDLSCYKRRQVEISADILKSRVQHYIFLSSAAIYKYSKIHLPYREGAPKRQYSKKNEYGFEKWQSERFLSSKGRLGWFKVTSIRPSYIYGPNNYADREIYIFKRLLLKEPVIIEGNGDNIIQLGHVQDLADVLQKVALNKKAFGEAFNYSGTELITINSLIRLIERISKKKALIIHKKNGDKANKHALAFPSFDYYSDNSKIIDQLGINPKITLESGLTMAYGNFISKM